MQQLLGERAAQVLHLTFYNFLSPFRHSLSLSLSLFFFLFASLPGLIFLISLRADKSSRRTRKSMQHFLQLLELNFLRVDVYVYVCVCIVVCVCVCAYSLCKQLTSHIYRLPGIKSDFSSSFRAVCQKIYKMFC